MDFRGFQKGILDYSLRRRCNRIGHFQIALILCFKVKLSAKPSVEMKKMFYFHENITHFLKKGCALTLFLKNNIFCKLVLVKWPVVWSISS